MTKIFFKSLLIFLLFIGFINKVQSQCSIDYSYTAPGIYPDPLPDGYAGQPYSQDITFVMPLDTMGATIQNFEIISIALPVGLTWQCNNSVNNCNYNPQTDQYGCIHISGTPLVTGQYNVDVSILVDVVASGQNIDNIPISFFMSFNISSATIGNSGFTSNPVMGCVPLPVNFTNNNPGLLDYYWNFGNGQSTNLENPTTQIYNQPGEYIVEYAGFNNLDTVDLFTLNEVIIHSINGGWGPEYIPFVYTNNKPDPYFILKENGNLIYQSSFVLNDNGPNSWPLNINLHPDSNYTIDVMDADQTAASANQYELLFGSDDYIGTYNLNFSSCNLCAAGSDATVSTTINYQQILPVPSVQSIDTIRVGTPPGIPNIVYDSSNYIVYTDSTNYILQWHQDTISLAGHNLAIDTITQSGNYFVMAYNNFGCSSSSDTVQIIYCDPSISFNIDLDGAQNLYITNFTNGYTVNWYNNGLLISGANSSLYTPNNSGDFQAMLTDANGCKYLSNSYTYNVGTNEVSQDWWLFPNPSSNQFQILWPIEKQFIRLEIINLNGEVIDIIELKKSPTLVITEKINAGIYLIKITSSSGDVFLKKQIIH